MPASNAKVHPYVVICGCVGVLLAIATIGGALRSPGSSEFRLHRDRYDRIIARIKEIGIQPNGNPRLWLSADLDPTTLSRKRSNNADMVGMVEAYRDETTGAYDIIITTQDRGHFGTFGYGYSDLPDHVPTEGYWTRERKLDAHWYIMANRSW